MGVSVQTRYQQVYTSAFSDVATSFPVDVAPAFTMGYGTIRRGYADQEDFKWQNTSGLNLTSCLRGLSPTALTDTEVLGLKKNHDLNSPSSVNTIEGTTMHYIMNDKASKTSAETITSAWTFSGTGFVFTNNVKMPGVLDTNGNISALFPATASAVNYFNIVNSATLGNLQITALGSDTNISIEFVTKGTGVVILPDGSELKTNAAPVSQNDIANKKYVDDSIAAASLGNASTVAKGVVQIGTPADNAAATGVGSTGAINVISSGDTTVSSRTGNRVPVTQNTGVNAGVIDPNIYDVDRVFAPKESVYGATISANDLLYLDTSDFKWKPVTSSAATWYNRLGIAIDAGVNNDTGKRILLRGRLGGMTYNNINPTFSSTNSGTQAIVGNTAANSAVSLLIDNSSGAEAVVTGGTIRAFQNGTPAGAMLLYLVLDSVGVDQAGRPACYKDTTANVVRGAIIGTASIAQALFSGTPADLSFSFGANVKIPAGARVHLVVAKTGAVDAANYYNVTVAAASAVLNETTQTWSGTENTGYFTLTVTSTSPVGYAVKAYTGSNGSHGLTPTNPWSRCIGKVMSSTEMFFDPENIQQSEQFAAIGLPQLVTTAVTTAGFTTVTTAFCPSFVNFTIANATDATADVIVQHKAKIRGDSASASSFKLETLAFTAVGLLNWLGDVTNAFTTTASIVSGTVSLKPTTTQQNYVHAVRLENGFHLYCSYPAGANILSGGVAGYAKNNTLFDIIALS